MSHEEVTELVSLLHRMMKLQYGFAQRCMEKEGFHRAQPGIIMELSKCDGLTQVELASRLGVTAATISAMIKRMERAELLYRERSEEDQRLTHIFLTPKGREHSIRVKAVITQINDVGFQDFSEEELKQTKIIFKKIIHNFEGFSN